MLEQGWECLQDRRHFRRLCLYYKIKNRLSPQYCVSLARNISPHLTSRFANSFFPYFYHKGKTLDASIRDAPSIGIFKSRFLHTIRPSVNSCFDVLDKRGMLLLTKLRVLRCKHNFNCPSPIRKCNRDHHSHFNALFQILRSEETPPQSFQ